jgi:hypothetical protein
MNFSSFADPFIPLLKTNKLSAIERSYDLILLSLYEDLLEGEKVVKILSKKKESINNIQLTNNSNFFPNPIRNYIKNTPASLYEFQNERNITINFYSFKDTVVKYNELEKYAKMMLTWLYICSKYSHKNCAKEMRIQIYLTPFNKTLPVNNSIVLSPENVNTAFTMSCVPDGEIIIFREEEWFKVFIHETFHAYGLDFGLKDSKSLFTVLKKTFPVKSEFSANEAYTETWARIINCALYSFFSLANNNTPATFLLYTDFCLQLERLFAIYQMNKVLNFMGLTYKDLHEVNERSSYLRSQLYKENTHVFGYYILPAIFLNVYRQFITWCSANNVVIDANNVVMGTNNVVMGTNNVVIETTKHGGFMKFNCEEKSFQKIGEYITSIYKDRDLLKIITTVQKIPQNNKNQELRNTTRMTVVDMKYIF